MSFKRLLFLSAGLLLVFVLLSSVPERGRQVTRDSTADTQSEWNPRQISSRSSRKPAHPRVALSARDGEDDPDLDRAFSPPSLAQPIRDAVDLGGQEVERGSAGGSQELECSSSDSEVRLGAPDDYQPIVKVAPRYPPEAALAGLSGYVLVEYTVAKSGNVREIHVMDASSPIFEQVAIQSVRKYRYQPSSKCGAYIAARLRTLIVFGDEEPQDLPTVDGDAARVVVTAREEG